MSEKNELEIVNEEFYKYNVSGEFYTDPVTTASSSLFVSSKTILKTNGGQK